MTRQEIAQLYSDRMHRKCVDDGIFNCWMLTNWQSDDALLPAAPLVIDTISEQSEDTLRVMVELACMEAWRGVSWN